MHFYDQPTESCVANCSRTTLAVDVLYAPVPQCKSCLDVDGMVQARDACLFECPPEQYESASRQCEPCSGLCLGCSGPGARQCDACRYATLADGTCARRYPPSRHII